MSTRLPALGSLGAWVAPCRGAGWRTLPDGRIELEGLGVPSHAPGTAIHKYVLQTWANWKPQFRSAAARFGIPAAWLLALATVETGLWSGNPEKQRTIHSAEPWLAESQRSIGIMQPITLVTKQYGYTSEDRYDPQKNIDLAARILVDHLKRTQAGFPAVATMFNAGHLCASSLDHSKGNVDPAFLVAGYQGKYLRKATSALNTALSYVPDIHASDVSPWLYGLGGVGLVIGGAFALGWLR
jgi:hypothetical protein